MFICLLLIYIPSVCIKGKITGSVIITPHTCARVNWSVCPICYHCCRCRCCCAHCPQKNGNYKIWTSEQAMNGIKLLKVAKNWHVFASASYDPQAQKITIFIDHAYRPHLVMLSVASTVYAWAHNGNIIHCPKKIVRSRSLKLVASFVHYS